ncbi:MAG: hypothetical protein ACKVQC_07975 [Elusimicrobiota bacterium]
MKISNKNSAALMKKTFLPLILGVIFIFSGCEKDKKGSSFSNPTPYTLNTQGSWTGEYSTSIYTSSKTVSMSFNQNGSTVQGSYSVPDLNIQGTVDGYIYTDHMDVVMNQTSPCAGTFTGTAEGNRPSTLLNIFFTGSDCAGSHTSGVIHSNR